MHEQLRTHNWHWPAALVLLALLGCKSAKQCQDIPPGAIPPPAGVHVNELNVRQAMKAEANDFVLYQYEWDGDGNQLDATGRRHVAMIADGLQNSECPVPAVTIETQNDPALDQAAATDRGGRPGRQRHRRRRRTGPRDYPSAEPMYGTSRPRSPRVISAVRRVSRKAAAEAVVVEWAAALVEWAAAPAEVSEA